MSVKYNWALRFAERMFSGLMFLLPLHKVVTRFLIMFGTVGVSPAGTVKPIWIEIPLLNNISLDWQSLVLEWELTP